MLCTQLPLKTQTLGLGQAGALHAQPKQTPQPEEIHILPTTCVKRWQLGMPRRQRTDSAACGLLITV